jgi:hypothetical protein
MQVLAGLGVTSLDTWAQSSSVSLTLVIYLLHDYTRGSHDPGHSHDVPRRFLCLKPGKDTSA